MEFPQELRLGIERLLEGEDTKVMTSAAEGISVRYRNDSGKGRKLVSQKRDILAYAAVRMPATFGAVSRALELSLENYGDEIATVLDVGAGTGAASHAAQMLTDCTEITCIERESGMIDLGKKLMDMRGLSAEWIQRDITDGISEKAELVVSSYCLNELSEGARRTVLERLWHSTEKLLVIVEPGTPEGFRQIKTARKTLVALGAHIVAPCPHAEDCPLEENDWCHFTARVQRSKLHRQLKGGDAPYEDEKFSFIAFSRDEVERNARIIRHPRIDSGRITLKLCTKDGIKEVIHTRKSPLFKSARKSDSGDSFPVD